MKQKECYEIRLESIGGLGANLIGKMLGELGAKYLDLNAASFSSYGSEKRGSAVKSYVRLYDKNKPILLNSPIEHPDMLVLFHEALARTMPVTAGVLPESVTLVNTDESPANIREKLKICSERIICIDALSLSIEYKCRTNMIMLGAIVKASGFIPLEAAESIVKSTLGKKYPAALESNLKGLLAGYENTKSETFKDGRFEPTPYNRQQGKLGYEYSSIGGLNFIMGSTISNDLSASREGYIPLFFPEKCIHCGLCDSTCPDMVFQFVKGEYKGKETMVNRGLDYHHCKGCLRCVQICPTEALKVGNEKEHPNKKWFVRNRDLITDNIDFDFAGADPYITSEAYLDEKRVDGGLK